MAWSATARRKPLLLDGCVGHKNCAKGATVTLNNAEMQDLTQDARLDVGRAWNSFVRYRKAQEEVASSRQDLMALLIKLRGGHGLSIRKLARVFGWSPDRVARFTKAYEDAKYEGKPRVKDMTAKQRRSRGRHARQHDLAGLKAAPGSEPSLVRSARIAREETGS